MKIIFIFLIPGIFYYSSTATAQTKKLHRGSSMDGIIASEVLNYKSTSLSFTELKSKFIILDFWNTSCISCIRSFPKIDSLQKLYEGKIQFILANLESCDSTIQFFKKRTSIKMPHVPMITNAKELEAMFEIESYPFTVWIDDAGIVRHFIGAHNLSENNLNSFISGKSVAGNQMDIPVYRGSYFNAGRPDNLREKLVYYCYLSRYTPEIDIGYSENRNINDSMTRIAFPAETIINLYKKAYREFDKYNFNKPGSVLLLVKDSARFIPPVNSYERDHWSSNNVYSFDLVLPTSRKDHAYEIMQQQLNMYFGLKARIIKVNKNGSWLDVLEIKE